MCAWKGSCLFLRPIKLNSFAMDGRYKKGLALAKTMPLALASTSDLVPVKSPVEKQATPWESGTLWENRKV